MTNRIKNHYYFDTRKRCGKFLFLCRRLGRRIIPPRIICFPHLSVLFPDYLCLVSSRISLFYIRIKNYWCILWHFNLAIVTPPNLDKKTKKEGVKSNSLLYNLHTMTRNAVQGIPGISYKKSIHKQKAFHTEIFYHR